MGAVTRVWQNPYSPKGLAEKVTALYADPYVTNRKGIFEYLLGSEENKKALVK